MTRARIETERILSEYGRRTYESHVGYFGDLQNSSDDKFYRPAKVKSLPRMIKRAVALCAILVLLMALTVVVCSALGIQVFNYKFDFKDGHIIITNLDKENGSHFYKPDYIADNYVFSEVVKLSDSSRYYIYINRRDNLDYTIEESTNSDDIVYADNENYDESKQTYGDYELVIFKDRESPLIITYLEKNNTYISISGHLTISQIHSIIDSLIIDE